MNTLKFKQIYGEYIVLTGSSITPDLTISKQFYSELIANTNVVMAIGIESHEHFELIIKQDATGGRILSFASGYVVSGNINITQNSYTRIHFSKVDTTVVVSMIPYITANNGLDKDGTNIVLGQDIGEAGDPAKLLSNREIPMDGKNLELEASNGDRTLFDGSNGNINVGGSTQSYNTGDGTKTNERYNTADGVNIEITNAKSSDNFGVRYVKFVQSKNGGINTGDDAVIEYLYPQDASGNNAAIHVSRGDGYIRDISGNLLRNINLVGSSDNGIYVLGDHGSWLSRTDYITGSGTNPPILSTSTTEPMAIDTATGQLGRMRPLANSIGVVSSENNWDSSGTYILSAFLINTTYTNTSNTKQLVRIDVDTEQVRLTPNIVNNRVNYTMNAILSSTIADVNGNTQYVDEVARETVTNASAFQEEHFDLYMVVELNPGQSTTFQLRQGFNNNAGLVNPFGGSQRTSGTITTFNYCA